MSAADLIRRYTRTYFQKLAFVASAGVVLWVGVWNAFGTLPSVGSVLNVVLMAAFLVARTQKELHRAHTFVFVFSLCVTLPLALTVDQWDLWWNFAMGMITSLAITFLCAWIAYRRRPRGVWLQLADGRDLPMDVREYTCEDCNRVHYAVFAQGEPVEVGRDVEGVTLHVDVIPHGRTEMPIMFERNEDTATIRVPAAPPGFGRGGRYERFRHSP